MGMAEYLADRLDPEVKTRDRGGRPPLGYAEELERWTRDVHIAIAVLSQWRTYKEAGKRYPQKSALEDVVEIMGLPEAEVRVAFSKCRACAEVVASLSDDGSRMDDLSDDELASLAAGPEDLMHLLLPALSKLEIARLATGEKLDSVLRT